MQLVYCNVCALAVAGIFYVWREYQGRYLERERMLRHRVAYMLWIMAGAAE